MQAVFKQGGFEGGEAFAAGMAHGGIQDAERAFVMQGAAYALRKCIAVGIDDARLGLAGFSEIGHPALRFHGIQPHLQAHGWLVRGPHEQRLVIAGFGDGGFPFPCAVKHAVAAVAEAAA